MDFSRRSRVSRGCLWQRPFFQRMKAFSITSEARSCQQQHAAVLPPVLKRSVTTYPSFLRNDDDGGQRKVSKVPNTDIRRRKKRKPSALELANAANHVEPSTTASLPTDKLLSQAVMQLEGRQKKLSERSLNTFPELHSLLPVLRWKRKEASKEIIFSTHLSRNSLQPGIHKSLGTDCNGKAKTTVCFPKTIPPSTFPQKTLKSQILVVPGQRSCSTKYARTAGTRTYPIQTSAKTPS